MTIEEYIASLNKIIEEQNNIKEYVDGDKPVLTKEQHRDRVLKIDTAEYKKTIIIKKLLEQLTAEDKKKLYEQIDIKTDGAFKKYCDRSMVPDYAGFLKKHSKDPTKEEGFKAEDTLEEYMNRTKESLIENCEKELNIFLETSKDEAFGGFFKKNADKVYSVINSVISKEKIEKAIEETDKTKNILERPTTKEYKYSEDVNKAKKLSTEEQQKVLDEANKELLVSSNGAECDKINKISESEPSYLLKYGLKRYDDFGKNNEVFKNQINAKNGELSVRIDTEQDVNLCLNEASKFKFKLSKETQKKSIEILKFFIEQKDIDGNLLFQGYENFKDEGTKIYAFKPYIENRAKAIDIVKKLGENDLPEEERTRLINQLQRCNENKKHLDKIYREVFNKIEAMDLKSYPTNISVSRNESMPEFAIKEYDSAATLNGFIYLFGMMKTMNKTPEEVFDNVDGLLKEKYDNNKNFIKFTNLFQNSTPLQFINTLASPSGYGNLRNDMLGELAITRQFLPIITLENDEELRKNNELKYYLYNDFMYEKARTEVDKFMLFFAEANTDDREVSVANILCASGDKDINAASLLPINERLQCPITGNTIEKFNATEYLAKEGTDLLRITNNVKEMEKVINNLSAEDKIKPNNKMLQKACDRVKADMVKNLVKSPDLVELYKTGYFSPKDIVNGGIVNNNADSETRTRFNSVCNTEAKANELYASTILVKGMSEKVRGMGFFHRHFSSEGIASKKLYNEMKNSLMKTIGVSKKDLYDMLASKTTMDKFVEDQTNKGLVATEVKEESKVQKTENKETRKSIIVGETKVMNNETDLSKVNTSARIKETEKGLNN